MWDVRLKELKATADLGNKAFCRLTDFTSVNEVSMPMMNTNTVISCVGSKIFSKRESDIEESNIRVPMAIARAVKKNP